MTDAPDPCHRCGRASAYQRNGLCVHCRDDQKETL